MDVFKNITNTNSKPVTSNQDDLYKAIDSLKNIGLRPYVKFYFFNQKDSDVIKSGVQLVKTTQNYGISSFGGIPFKIDETIKPNTIGIEYSDGRKIIYNLSDNTEIETKE